MRLLEQDEHQVDLGGMLKGLSLSRQIIALSLWPFLQNMLGTLVSVADRVIAGSTMSESALPEVFDAMGLIVYVAWLMMIVMGAVATGAQALVSRAFGAQDEGLANKASGQSLILGVIAGGLSGTVVWALAPVMASVFGLDDASTDYAVTYLRVLVWSTPFSAIIFVANACLRAGGDTKTPFVIMLVVNLVNVFSSVCLMRGWLLASEYGILGLAWGSLIGWAAGAMMILYYLFARRVTKRVLAITRHDLVWDWYVGRRIVRVGLPQCFEIIGMWSIHIFGVWVIANQIKGDGVLGAHGLVVMVESLSFMPGFALGSAAATLAGQYLGAGSKLGALRAVRVCWVTGVCVMGASGLLIVLFAEPLVQLMSPGEGAQNKMAVEVLRYVGWVQPFFATAMVLKMAMRGAGATAIVMIGSFSTMLVFRVGAVYVASTYYPESLSLLQVWWIMILDLVAQALLFAAIYRRRAWLDAVV
ncbi:MATE family efflux transporter [Rubritalea marina]|uniref:MATE family efflux transporter n=1 Tax=Rubritalea marina TaxID=361055 RepID=UPI00039F7600|nr:MATE family efflux transporter [Rubritalea marina]